MGMAAVKDGGLDHINTSALKDLRKIRVLQSKKAPVVLFHASDARRSVLQLGSGALGRKPEPETTAETVDRFISMRVIGQYIRTCKNVGVDYNLGSSITPFLVSNMKSIEHEVVMAAVYEANDLALPFVDWAWVKENIVHKNQNSLGDVSSWLSFLKHVCFNDDIEEQFERHRCLNSFKHLLRGAGFAGRDEIYIRDAVKIYLLLNVIGLTGYHAMERYLDDVLGGNLRTRCLQFTANLGDQRYTTEEYNDAAVALLSCIMVSESFGSDVQIHIATKKDLEVQMKQKQLEVYKGRPRLLSLLNDRKQSDKLLAGSAYNMNTFDSWMNFTKFPNTISKKTRGVVYLMMSTPGIDHAEWVHKCLTKDMALSVLAVPIVNPEVQVLSRIISDIDFRSQAFLELAKFRSECLVGLSPKHLKEMTLSVLMQLYVCAYQCKHVWKECWRHVLPVMSFPIIQMVENFVSKHPINEVEFYKTLVYGGD